MIGFQTVDALSTIRLLQSIEAMHPPPAPVHVHLHNARHHRARLVQAWLAAPGRRTSPHFIPPCRPHLDPIERLRGLMHEHVTRNKSCARCNNPADATPGFQRDNIPENREKFRDAVTGNFHIISPKDFRIMA